MNTRAYLYKWTQISTGKWYVGSRAAKGCYPDDGYICSSKAVKPLIAEQPLDWVRTVLAIGHQQYIIDLERKYLQSLNAKNDPLSFNMHNGDGIFPKPAKLLGTKDFLLHIKISQDQMKLRTKLVVLIQGNQKIKHI